MLHGATGGVGVDAQGMQKNEVIRQRRMIAQEGKVVRGCAYGVLQRLSVRSDAMAKDKRQHQAEVFG